MATIGHTDGYEDRGVVGPYASKLSSPMLAIPPILVQPSSPPPKQPSTFPLSRLPPCWYINKLLAFTNSYTDGYITPSNPPTLQISSIPLPYHLMSPRCLQPPYSIHPFPSERLSWQQNNNRVSHPLNPCQRA